MSKIINKFFDSIFKNSKDTVSKIAKALNNSNAGKTKGSSASNKNNSSSSKSNLSANKSTVNTPMPKLPVTTPGKLNISKTTDNTLKNAGDKNVKTIPPANKTPGKSSYQTGNENKKIPFDEAFFKGLRGEKLKADNTQKSDNKSDPFIDGLKGIKRKAEEKVEDFKDKVEDTKEKAEKFYQNLLDGIKGNKVVQNVNREFEKNIKPEAEKVKERLKEYRDDGIIKTSKKAFGEIKGNAERNLNQLSDFARKTGNKIQDGVKEFLDSPKTKDSFKKIENGALKAEDWLDKTFIAKGIRKIPDKQSKANYESNKKKDKVNEYIYDQNKLKKFKFGNVDIGFAGCEVVAVNNALKYFNKNPSMAELIKEFEDKGLVTADAVLNGYFGSNPNGFPRLLKDHGIKTEKISLDNMDKEGFYVISYWNDHEYNASFHTIAVQVDENGRAKTYNDNINGLLQLQRDPKRYIVGYRLTEK